MYNDVRNLFNKLHELVFKNYEIEYLNISTEHILIKSIVDGFFIRIDFDKHRMDQYKNTIQFGDVDYRCTDEVPLDNFDKHAYFDAVMLNTELKYEDAYHIAGNASMFAKATGRSVRVYIVRERKQVRR